MTKEVEMFGYYLAQTQRKRYLIVYYDNMAPSWIKEFYWFERTIFLRKCSFLKLCWWMKSELYKLIRGCAKFHKGLYRSKFNDTKFAPKLLRTLLNNNSITTSCQKTGITTPKLWIIAQLNLLENPSEQAKNFALQTIKI